MNPMRTIRAAMLAATALAPPALAQDNQADVDALRREVQELRAQVQILKEQLGALVTAGVPAPAAALQPAPAATPEATPATAYPVPAAPAARSSNVMNPAISGVFQLIGDTAVGGRNDANGFDLSEAEVAFESTVDPYARMNLYLTFPAGDSPEVEEGYATTQALPAGLQLKGGRFKSSFGKWNTLHTHAFFTVERPDAFVNFFGEESLTNDGLSLSWLIPNPAGLYLDATTEVGTAREGPSFNGVERALTWSEHVAAFFNPSDNTTLEAGVSGVFGQAGPTDTVLADIDAAGLAGVVVPDDRLPSDVYGLDVTWKWKPLQRNTFHSFLWQTEMLASRRVVQTLIAGPSLDQATLASSGGYTYVEGQWTKRWKLGLRYDLSGFPDSGTDRTWGTAGVVKFIPSEFQELRFEVKHTEYNDGAAARFGSDGRDTRLLLEWIPVIGAHGAHKY